MVTLDTLRALHAARSQTRGVLPDVRVPPCSLAPGPPTGVLTQIATAAPTVARWLVAAVAALFASAAGAEVRYIPVCGELRVTQPRVADTSRGSEAATDTC